MNKYIIILCTLLALCLGSCQDDMGIDNKVTQRDPNNGLPITFVTELQPMAIVGDARSRADIEDRYKEQFVEGDYLHIFATFTRKDAGGNTTTESQYDFLRYDGNEWQSTASPDNPSSPTAMTWPYDAISADFTAYYIGRSEEDGWLTTIGSSTENIRLDGLTETTDPLVAEAKDIEYGHAVPLHFTHLCTKLTIVGVKESADEYWVQQTGLSDAFKLTRTESGLTFKFVNTDTENAKVAAQRTGDYVSFYLAPDDYQGMQLTYRYGRPYLTLNMDELNELKANISYVASISENTGSIIIDEDEDDEWDNPNGDHVNLQEMNIDKFLDAICKGTEYSITQENESGETETIEILRQVPDREGHTELLVNVNFQGKAPQEIHNLPNSAYFDGTGHYVVNTSGPLFNNIEGTIVRLGVSDATIITSETQAAGAIGRTCTSTSALNTIRLNNITITVTPPTDANLLCDVGALVGNSAGDIEFVRLGGNISVTVHNNGDTNTPLGRIYVGGLIGQLSGWLYDVARFNEETPGIITVTNSCSNNIGERYTGGLVGLSTGDIGKCTMKATVDASQARGVLVYTGGLVGMARGPETTTEEEFNGIYDSTFDGIIRVGRAYSTEENVVEGHAYAGGLVGYAYQVKGMERNQMFGTLYGPIGDDENTPFVPYENSIYATGGLFGQAYQSPSTGNTTWISLESQYMHERYYVGKIAGRADSDSDVTTNNTSHTAGTWESVGGTIDASDVTGNN